ncbi:MAG: DNA-binding domain-containing protein [Myxococcota bacterium]
MKAGMRFPDLAGVQALVWRLIAAPEGVRRGAEELHREGRLASEDLSFLVPPDERLEPPERLDIYADMYFYRLRDCLAEDFPKVVARVGPVHWHNLVTDYLLAHPSTHFSLRELGRALPGFLERSELTKRFPALEGLARLEWARVDVFDETDAAPLTREDLLAQGAAAPASAAFALVPSTRLLRLDASVLPLWKSLEEQGVENGTPRAGEKTAGVLVWRKTFAIFHRSLEADEERCLWALAAGGATLAELGELLATAQPPGAAAERAAAERLAALIDRWARDALLRTGESTVPGAA